jgi:hypothetical protein
LLQQLARKQVLKLLILRCLLLLSHPTDGSLLLCLLLGLLLGLLLSVLLPQYCFKVGSCGTIGGQASVHMRSKVLLPQQRPAQWAIHSFCRSCRTQLLLLLK